MGPLSPNRFYGVVSNDIPIFRTEIIHPSLETDNFGIGTLYFTSIPEATSAGPFSGGFLSNVSPRPGVLGKGLPR